MELEAIMIEAAIYAGADGLSDVVDLLGGVLVAIQMPATWVAADLTFQVSLDGVNFANLYDIDGNEIVVSAAASRVIGLTDVERWLSGGKIKIRSGTSGTPVNQTAERKLKLAVLMG